MDSDKLQKLANLVIVRQHAATITNSTNFQRKFINEVNNCLSKLDSEFVSLLLETVKTSVSTDEKDALTISQRLAEEKAKLNAAKNTNVKEEPVKTESRPTIKTTRSKKNETTNE